MIQKSMFQVVALAVMTIALTACGGHGIDRKLNYSGSQEDLAESYAKAMTEATPEQQNILRKRADEVLDRVLRLAKYSNPAITEAVRAKKNAEEFEQVKKMTVRELFIWHLSWDQNILNAVVSELEGFNSGKLLIVENFSVESIDPNVFNPDGTFVDVRGKFLLRNDSKNFKYDSRDCSLAILVDGKQLDEFRDSCDITQSTRLNVNGGKATFSFRYRINGNQNVRLFYETVRDSQFTKIGLAFKPSEKSYIRSNDGADSVYGLELKSYKERLESINKDLAVMKK